MKVKSLSLAALTASVMLALIGCTQFSSSPADLAAKTIRIKAGIDKPLTDSAGNVWAPESGFEGGSTFARDAKLAIANTTTPELYRTEHYGMTAFSTPLPNGKYTVKLHFAETYDAISAIGERIFSIDVAGTPIKDFDPVKEAGGNMKAIVKTVPVTITTGKLAITFTAKEQSTVINAIEITPAN